MSHVFVYLISRQWCHHFSFIYSCMTVWENVWNVLLRKCCSLLNYLSTTSCWSQLFSVVHVILDQKVLLSPNGWRSVINLGTKHEEVRACHRFYPGCKYNFITIHSGNEILNTYILTVILEIDSFLLLIFPWICGVLFL